MSTILSESALEPRYFERMSKSTLRKAELVQFAKSGSVLDVGSGGGDLAETFMNAGFAVTALDGNSESVARTARRGIPAVHGFAEELDELFAPESFDNVLFSSVLHEVFSYGKGEASINRALEAAYRVLKPGGKILIRDGVRPDNWTETAYLFIDDRELSTLVQDYLHLNPFRHLGVALEKVLSDGELSIWAGDYFSCMEALYTVNWGRGSLHRESQELFGVFTQAGYLAKLSETGFVNASSQDDGHTYKDYLRAKARILTGAGEESWPVATALWTASKP